MTNKGLKFMGIMALLCGLLGCGTPPQEQGYPVAPDAKFIFKDYIHLDTTNIMNPSTGRVFRREGLQDEVIRQKLLQMHPWGSSVKALEETLYKGGLRKKMEMGIGESPAFKAGVEGPTGYMKYTLNNNEKHAWGVYITYNVPDVIDNISILTPSGGLK